MKRVSLVLLAALLLFSFSACGKNNESLSELPAVDASSPAPAENSEPPAGEMPSAEPPAPVYSGSYRRVDITADNWTKYFELKEIPLYTVSQGEVIAQVCQYYCVVLREEYRPYLKPAGNYRVDFSLSFGLYIDTMDIDTNEGVYRHTDDLFYAVDTTKKASFDRYALPSEAYGADASAYAGFSNAFFTGYCALHAESGVWSGFYIDLSQVRLESVSGYLELGGQLS